MSVGNLIAKISKKVQYIINRIRQHLRGMLYQSEMKKLISKINDEDKPTIIFLDIVDWNIPLFQRPQHIARFMAKENYNYLFFTTNSYDDIRCFEKKEDNLYVINGIFKKQVIKELNISDKYIQLYSTDMKTKIQDIGEYKKYDYNLIYEYIDEISPELYGSKIPQSAWDKHQYLIKDQETFVICTARKLYQEVISNGKKSRVTLITNGVEYEHFSRENRKCPLKDLMNKSKPIIGYFGAFANWFDYELIEKLAEECPQYEILLIGWEYDNSLSKSNVKKYDNVTVMGPISYNELPNYASCFDLSIIPFKINDVTESTSPIKLFEYMALGKPILTTNMPECNFYKSVLIASSKQEFIELVQKALDLKNDYSYIDLLKKEAKENTWEYKAKKTIEFISE